MQEELWGRLGGLGVGLLVGLIGFLVVFVGLLLRRRTPKGTV